MMMAYKINRRGVLGVLGSMTFMALAGVVAIAACHAMMIRNCEIPAHGRMIAIATTAASWTHSRVQKRLGRSFRTIAARIAAPRSAKGMNQEADTGEPSIVPPVMNLLIAGEP
jgi:glycerol dehydrogenase-like iron-containing ADH family enzyme